MTTFVFPVHSLAYDRMVEKAEEGVMPTLKGLMDRGCYGVSKSVYSTASPVDYTAMLTGTSPENNGIVDIQTNTVEGAPFWNAPVENHVRVIPPTEVEDSRLFTSYDVDVPWVWELLPDYRVMQFGIFSPTTYPAPELPNEGIWVSGYWNSPSTYLKDNVAACNDQSVRADLLDEYSDYQVGTPFAIPPVYPPDTDSERSFHREMLSTVTDISDRTHAARRTVAETRDWDILVSEEGICDNVQHLLWPRSPDNPDHTEMDRWLDEEGLLDDFYRHVDSLLESYLRLLPEDANIVVISAHGQSEAESEGYMHDDFKFMYKYDIWDVPADWEYMEERPSWSPPTRAEHDRDGAYIVAGPAFADGGASRPISCMDFAPLMLALHGADVPVHMDGRVPGHLLNGED